MKSSKKLLAILMLVSVFIIVNTVKLAYHSRVCRRGQRIECSDPHHLYHL